MNEEHPERNTDVILFLDTFVEAREEDESTLDVAVRAAATLADRYLERKDRVGLVSFGGYLNWLLPGSGLVQLYRIVDSLLDTEIILSYAWKGVDVIPPRTLPPKALVLAITPLLDERAVTTLLDLRARGFDLAVIEVSPVRVRVGRGGRARGAGAPALAAASATRCARGTSASASRSWNGTRASRSKARSRRWEHSGVKPGTRAYRRSRLRARRRGGHRRARSR